MSLPAPAGGPGSDIINLGVTTGQKLVQDGGSHVVYQNLQVLLTCPNEASVELIAWNATHVSMCNCLRLFYRDMVHLILIMMSLPGPTTSAGICDNPG